MRAQYLDHLTTAARLEYGSPQRRISVPILHIHTCTVLQQILPRFAFGSFERRNAAEFRDSCPGRLGSLRAPEVQERSRLPHPALDRRAGFVLHGPPGQLSRPATARPSTLSDRVSGPPDERSPGLSPPSRQSYSELKLPESSAIAPRQTIPHRSPAAHA